MSFEIRQVETAYQGYAHVMKATLAAADGSVSTREIEHHGDAAAVLAYDPERRVAMLARLPRAPVIWAGGPPEMAEAAAGMLDHGEPPETAARREALEECGLRLGVLEPVATVFSSPGLSAEQVSLFLAPYAAADRAGPGGGAEGESEHVTVLEMDLAELWRRAERGEVRDLKTLALIYALRLRRPELFGG